MENSRKKFLFFATLISTIALCCVTFFSVFAEPTYASALLRSPDVVYNDEFYCKTIDSEGEHYLTYNGTSSLVKTENPADALFHVNFVDNSTVTLINKSRTVAYTDGSAYLKDGSEDGATTEWILDHGLLKQSSGRKLLFNVGASLGRCYDKGVSPTYTAVYFYSSMQYNDAESRCQSLWSEDRQTQLSNLKYELDIEELCTISFNANGGSGNTSPIYVASGSTYTVPASTSFTAPAGKRFSGWALSAEGEKITSTIEITGDITLYAIWIDTPAETTVLIRATDGTATTNADYSIVRGGITVAVTASTLTSEHLRIFKNQKITISSSAAHKITQIVFTCVGNGTSDYGPGKFGTGAPSGYTYETGGKHGTWTGELESVEFTAKDAQVRIVSIEVTYLS